MAKGGWGWGGILLDATAAPGVAFILGERFHPVKPLSTCTPAVECDRITTSLAEGAP